MKAKAVSKKRTKVISVTDMDIELGLRGDSEVCPVARSIARSFKKKIGTFSVAGDIARESHGEFLSLCLVPKTARDFIRRFDNDKIVKPFSFVMEY